MTEKDQVARILEGLRTLSVWQRGQHPGHRRWNRLVDQINTLAEAVVTDPDQLRELRLATEKDPDRAVRTRARWVVRPFVPRPGSGTDLQRWLNDPQTGLGALDLDIRAGLAVVPDQHGSGLSWFCGEPIRDLTEWPRRDDGVPLAHLLQVDLGYDPMAPVDGVLQFFHDLEATGDEPGDWLVHHIAEPGEDLLNRPDDHDEFRERQPARTEQTWTFPDPLDLDLDDATFELLQNAHERVLETVTSSWGVDELTAEPDPVPLMFGHSTESRLLAEQRLADVLPLADGDSYVLLADIPGVGPLDGWIGDMRHIEFWMRDSDLTARSFDRAWALWR